MSISCIYCITNQVNGKVYVGYTNDYAKRKAGHLYGLRNNKHGNEHLQKAWDKYGESNFVFAIIDTYDEEYLASMENYWCNMLDSHNSNHGYNIQPCMMVTKPMTNSRSRKVCQYSLKGEFINEFKGFKAADKATGIDASSIRDCCKKKRRSAGEFIWAFIEDKDLTYYFNSFDKHYKKVEQYDLSGNLVNTYKSVREACNYLNVFHQSISKACRDSKIYKKSKWKYV